MSRDNKDDNNKKFQINVYQQFISKSQTHA